MLGRYIAVTLLVLGGAMLVAPEKPRETADPAGAAPATRAADTPNIAVAGGVSPGVRTVSLSASPERSAQTTSLEQTVAAAEPVADPPEAEVVSAGTDPSTDAGAIPLSDALDDAVLATLVYADGDTAIPSLEEPGSIETFAVSAQTLSLISDIDDGASGGSAPADSAIAVEQVSLEADAAEAPDASAQAEPEILYVTGSRVNLRAGPSTDYSVIGSVTFGDAVELVADLGGDWAEIKVADGSTGFMARRYLEY